MHATLSWVNAHTGQNSMLSVSSHGHTYVSATTSWYVPCTLLTVHHLVALCLCVPHCSLYTTLFSLTSHCSPYTTLLPCVCVSHTAHCIPLRCLVLLFRNTVEKEEKKAGTNVTDRVFTPKEVRARLAYSSIPCQYTLYTVVASFPGSILNSSIFHAE